jgi:hypothetical protein
MKILGWLAAWKASSESCIHGVFVGTVVCSFPDAVLLRLWAWMTELTKMVVILCSLMRCVNDRMKDSKIE